MTADQAGGTAAAPCATTDGRVIVLSIMDATNPAGPMLSLATLDDIIRTWWPLPVALAVAWLTWETVRWIQRGPRFGGRPPGTPIFRRSWGSGRSLRSRWSRLCWANNCLRVELYRTELRVRLMPPLSWFPFAALCNRMDVQHRVPMGDIVGVEAGRHWGHRAVTISYRDRQRGVRSFELIVREVEGLIADLERLGCPTGGPESTAKREKPERLSSTPAAP